MSYPHTGSVSLGRCYLVSHGVLWVMDLDDGDHVERWTRE